MKKRILFISQMYPTNYDKAYGKVIHEQALSLIEANHEVRVICPVPYTPVLLKFINKKYLNYYNIPNKETCQGVEVYYPRYLRLPKSLLMSYSGVFMFYAIWGLAKKIKKDFAFDVIHAHFILPDAYAAMNLSSYFNKPLVTTLQATDLDVTVNRNKKCKENIFKVLKHSKAVISPSPRLASQLKNIFGLTSHVIGYGIDVRKVNIETPIDLINKYYDKIVIVSVSRLIDSKGLEYNIKAIYELKDRYPNITYLIIGDGSIKDSLVNLVDGLGLKDYVEFLGELSHKKAMEYIKIATIFSLPSWQETFGLVYLEAMVNEKPVIGCKGQGFDGIIKHCENGFLADSKDVNSIIQIINHILTKPLIAKEIASKGNYTALSNFTFDAIARKISCVYDDVLGKRNIK